jgi:hypothetical protein
MSAAVPQRLSEAELPDVATPDEVGAFLRAALLDARAAGGCIP